MKHPTHIILLYHLEYDNERDDGFVSKELMAATIAYSEEEAEEIAAKEKPYLPDIIHIDYSLRGE